MAAYASHLIYLSRRKARRVLVKVIVAMVAIATIGIEPADADRPTLASRRHPFLGAVRGMAQTPDGHLWFGARQGLHRFDGVDFKRYSGHAAPSLPGHVHSLLATRDGGLWLATGDGDLSFGTGNFPPLFSERRGVGALAYKAPGRDEFTPVAHDREPADLWVWGMAESSDETLWIGTDHGLRKSEPPTAGKTRRAESVPCPPLPADAVIADVMIDARQALWMATDRGLFVRRAGVCAATELGEPVIAIAFGRDRRVFAATRGDVVQLDDRTIERRYTIAHGLPRDGARALLMDSAGDLWVGTRYGVWRIDRNGVVENVPAVPGFSVLQIMQDLEGSIWVAAQIEGVVQVHRTFVQNLGVAEGLGADATFAVLVTRDGSTWVSHTAGVSRISSAGQVTNYAYERDLPVWQVRSLTEGPDGTVWMSSGGEGIVAWRQGRFERFSVAGTPSLGTTRTVAISRDGALWVGRDDGTLVHFAEGTPRGPARSFGPAQGACAGETLAATQSPDGVMWFGTRNGLSRVQGDRIRCMTVADGLPSNDVVSLLADADGTLWLGSRSDVGLVRLRGAKVQVAGAALGVPAGGTFRILDDGAGHLWWSSSVGLHRAPRASVEAALEGQTGRIPILTLDQDDGIASSEFISAFDPAGFATEDGRLRFPSPRGLVVVTDPEVVGSLVHAQPAVVELRSVGRSLPVVGSVTTAPGSVDLELRYTAPSFLMPHRLRFEHRLDGLDAAWVDAGTQRTTRYANVAPGTYTFRLRVFDGLNEARRTEASLTIRVPPRFFQTTWFRVALMLGAVVSIIAAHRKRVSVLRARHLAVHAERARIARDLHDHLGQSLGAVGFLTDALHLSRNGLPDGANELVTRLRGAVSHTRSGVNDLIWNLRAAGDETSLQSALRAVVERSRGQGAAVVLNLPPGPIAVPALLVQEVPFVVQEAITNAIRHGRATTITVEVVLSDSTLTVLVRDDGIGWTGATPSPSTSGFGLIGLNERAQRMKGTLTIGPTDVDRGTGTLVRLTAPLT